jgi:hypothetical protein
MMPSLKLLLRIFVFASCAFGGGIGIAVAIVLCVDGVGRALLVGGVVTLALGMPYGLAMSLILGGWHILAVRRLGHRLTDETLCVRQRRQLMVGLPLPQAFALCTASIRFLGNADVEEESDSAAGVILVTKRWSLLSIGERIRFKLHQAEDGTAVEIECRPWVRTTMIDFGTSLRNMDAIVGFLLAHAGPAGASPPQHDRATFVDRRSSTAEHYRPEDGPSRADNF